MHETVHRQSSVICCMDTYATSQTAVMHTGSNFAPIAATIKNVQQSVTAETSSALSWATAMQCASMTKGVQGIYLFVALHVGADDALQVVTALLSSLCLLPCSCQLSCTCSHLLRHIALTQNAHHHFCVLLKPFGEHIAVKLMAVHLVVQATSFVGFANFAVIRGSRTDTEALPGTSNCLWYRGTMFLVADSGDAVKLRLNKPQEVTVGQVNCPFLLALE